MASKNNIKGITIEISGNTAPLDKALSSVNTKTKQLQSELKGVETLLKFNPSNVTLLKQKQDILNQSIGMTKDKLSALKNAQSQVQEQFEKGEITIEQYRDFQREIISTENKLKSLVQEMKNFGSVASQQIMLAGDNLNKFGTKIENAGKKTAGMSATLLGLGTAAVAVGSNFDASMKQVAATMGITVEEIENGSESYKILESAAKECGENTKYSASEAADALNYLALAGYNAEQSAATLPKVLNLAAAGGLDLATASDMVTDAMAALGMETSDLDNYIDEMAKTSQKSNTSVQQLGEATLTVAGTVKMAGMSLETMNTELGILANNGIKGAEGGTHLRNIILSLTSPTDNASAALKKLGINVFDSKGNVRDLNNIMSDFNKKLDGLSDGKKTEIISSIFNKTDISAVNALIKGSGDEFKNLKECLNDCDGAAENMANTMNSSLSGQFTLLKSKLEGIANQITTYLMPVLQLLLDKISSLLTWFSNLSPITQKIILAVSGFIVILTPLLITIGKLISSVGTIIKIIPNIISIISTVKTVLSGLFSLMLANPISIIIVAISGLVAGFIYLWNHCESFRNFWINLWNVIKSICSGAIEAVKNLFDFIILSDFWSFLVSGAQNAWLGIKNIFSNLASFFGNIFSDAWSRVKTVFSTGGQIFAGIKEAISSVFTTAVNGIISGINKVVALPFNTLNKALNKVRNISVAGVEPFKDKWNENPIKVPQIPLLRTGGELLGSGQAIMAEAGSPELITMLNGKTYVRPLTNRDRKEVLNNSSTENYTLNINNNSKYTTPSENIRNFRNFVSKYKLRKG